MVIIYFDVGVHEDTGQSGHKYACIVHHTGLRGLYPYTSHLLEFERRRPVSGVEAVQDEWSAVQTPLVSAEWEAQLRDHPDRQFVEYLLHGIREY